jgi:dihydroorotate dehydrogenase (fumarate)
MDLTTRYMGLRLKNPLVASASPLTGKLDSIRRLEDAGAAAIVLPSLFEEEIEAEASRYASLTTAHDNSWPEANSNFPALVDYELGPEQYLEHIRKAAAATAVPVIASLNGVSNEGWISYAKKIEEAGAQGLELNIYFIAADITASGRDVEQRYLDILKSVRGSVSIPVAIKLSPYFSSLGNMALALQEAGADGLVLFNRFYQPDLDPVQLRVLNDLNLSEPSEIRLPLLWLAVLAGRVKASLAASTGVSSASEVIKYLLVGADVVMTTSALLRNGEQHIGVLLAGLEAWLTAREFSSLTDVRGIMSQQKLKDPQAFERANYIKILQGYKSPHTSRPKHVMNGITS